jgi:DNA-binding transcriptional LysR family regulator
VAAPEYLARRGVPVSPAELVGHDALIYSTVQGDARWLFSGADGQAQPTTVRGPLRSNNLSALLAAARGGLGLAALPWYVAYESVQSGAVQPVLNDWSLPSQEIHAVFPSPRLVPAKVSGFIEWLQRQIGERWWVRTNPAPGAADDRD